MKEYIGKEYIDAKGNLLVEAGECGRFIDLENTEHSSDYRILTKYTLEQYLLSGELKEMSN